MRALALNGNIPPINTTRTDTNNNEFQLLPDIEWAREELFSKYKPEIAEELYRTYLRSMHRIYDTLAV